MFSIEYSVLRFGGSFAGVEFMMEICYQIFSMLSCFGSRSGLGFVMARWNATLNQENNSMATPLIKLPFQAESLFQDSALSIIFYFYNALSNSSLSASVRVPEAGDSAEKKFLEKYKNKKGGVCPLLVNCLKQLFVIRLAHCLELH